MCLNLISQDVSLSCVNLHCPRGAAATLILAGTWPSDTALFRSHSISSRSRVIPAASSVTLRKQGLFWCAIISGIKKPKNLQTHTRHPTCSLHMAQCESCFPLLGTLPPSRTSRYTTHCVPQLLSDDSMLCHPRAISAWVNCLALGGPAAPRNLPLRYCLRHHLLSYDSQKSLLQHSSTFLFFVFCHKQRLALSIKPQYFWEMSEMCP